jgi:hypothetical protein
MFRFSMLVVAALMCVLTQAASAGLIQVQLGGVDLRYAGSTLTDANPYGGDALTNATFLEDSVELGKDETDVTLDLFIPGVTGISVHGDQVNSLPGGTLDLQMGGGDHVILDLESVQVTYLSVSSLIKFTFAGTVSMIVSQQLPYSLALQDPVTVTFSTQITSGYSEAAGLVSTFNASGTGELQSGDLPYIPEPASMALLGLGGLMMVRRCRSRA